MKYRFSRLLAAALRPLIIVLALLAVFANPARASSFAAALSPQLSTDPDLCAYAPCRDVLPGADSFSLRQGQPPYVEAYKTEENKKRLLGYVFLSTDIVDTPGYSGKPVVTLIGMDSKGVIAGIRILKHSEPLLLSGIPENVLIRFINQYVGKFVGDKIEIGESRPEQGIIGLDAISGATVTVISENQVVLRCGMAIARQVGIIKTILRQQAKLAPPSGALDWPALLKEGSIQRLTVEPATVGLRSTGRPYIDLYFGYLNAPDIGRSVLGEIGYENLMSRLKKGDNAIFVIASGMASFKGGGFVHGGIYDRILIAQDMDTFTFRDIDSLVLDGIKADHAPAYSEAAIFILRGQNFSAAYPWQLIFRGSRSDEKTGAISFVNFEKDYWLSDRYLEGGRPFYERPDPTWLRVWENRPVEIAFFILFLIAAGVTYAARNFLVRRATRKDKRWVSIPKYALWIISIGYVGFYLMAQPSITQVLTLLHSLLFKWEWALFLSDPFIFLFWWFIIITVFFWGRGMFCGWLCPYGTLTEIVYKLAATLGLKRYQGRLPDGLHDKLKWLKYAVFFGLLGASFYSMELAEQLAEVEPFKTTFLVGVWNRSWPFVAFWGTLFAASLFVERPFCKYLCPLGASLAIPSTFRWWGLSRKQECGPCKACGEGCESRAIDKAGQIDQRECLLCLDCMVMYYDEHSCPPLAQERKQRIKAGDVLTPVGTNGYYIPIRPLPAPAAPAAARLSVSAWLGGEIIDLFPWSGTFSRGDILYHAIGIGLAAMVSWVWLLGAAGKLGHGIVLGWWLVWSAYELATRMNFKSWVREGPWWERKFRPANWADMAAYVGLKNLLIAVLLFLVMKDSGLVALLQEMPEIKWLG